MASDFLQTTKADLGRRRDELKSALADVEGMRAELRSIEAALAALNGSPNGSQHRGTTRARRPKASPRQTSTKVSGSRNGARKRRSKTAQPGQRREQLLKTLTDHPQGLTIKQAGEKMGVKNDTPLYGIAKNLASEGLAVKSKTDKTWKPTTKAATPAPAAA